MKRLLPFMEDYKKYAILTPVLMVLEVTMDILLPYLMAKIVDVGIVNRDLNYIFRLGVLMLLLALFAMFFGVLSTIFGAKAGHGFASAIRLETFKKIQDFSFANLDAFTVSSLVTRLTNDITIISQTTVMSLRLGFRSPFMMIFALLMAIKISPQLALVFIVAIPLSFLVMLYILKKAHPLFVQLQHFVDKLNGRIKENLSGIALVKSFNRKTFEQEKFAERNKDLRDTSIKAMTTLAFLNPLLNMIMYTTIIAVLWYGGLDVVSGTLNQGELISFITYITQVLLSLIVLSSFFMLLLRGITSKDRILEVWDTLSELEEKEQVIDILENGDIEFKDVCFRYHPEGEDVLKNINVDIKSGEIVGIIGATGSSKSSLVQLIPRLYDVTSGEVFVSSHNVKDYDLKVLRDQIAFVLQKNTLFEGTIRENLLWGDPNASDEGLIAVLKQASAWDFVSEMAEGLDSRVEEGGDNFSGGQRQRLCIARALLKDPKIIILDDSTSAIDLKTDAKIQKMFKEDLKDLTTLVIAQRISSIEHANKIILLHEGEIVDVASHETLLERSLIYQEIFESQGGCIHESQNKL